MDLHGLIGRDVDGIPVAGNTNCQGIAHIDWRTVWAGRVEAAYLTEPKAALATDGPIAELPPAHRLPGRGGRHLATDLIGGIDEARLVADADRIALYRIRAQGVEAGKPGLQAVGRSLRSRHGCLVPVAGDVGQDECRENGDQSDDDEQLDQSETFLLRFGAGLFLPHTQFSSVAGYSLMPYAVCGLDRSIGRAWSKDCAGLRRRISNPIRSVSYRISLPAGLTKISGIASRIPNRI